MFGFLTSKQQLIKVMHDTEVLQTQQKKTSANIDYIAMMADVELEDLSDFMEGGEE